MTRAFRRRGPSAMCEGSRHEGLESPKKSVSGGSRAGCNEENKSSTMSEVAVDDPKNKFDVKGTLRKAVTFLRSMDTSSSKQRLIFVRQSSLAPQKARKGITKEESQKLLSAAQLDATLQLLFYASKGDVVGVQAMIDKNINVNAADFDQRTALHIAACENHIEVVKLLIKHGAEVNAEDRWGSTPLGDAQHYGNIEICKLLEANQGKLAKNARNSLMRMSSALVPEYEIDQSTLSFYESDTPAVKGNLHRPALWQGTKVWVKFLPGNIAANEQFVRKFKDELALLLKLRHPNVVQFLGAVTQSCPMMIVTEFLSGGSLKNYISQGRMEPQKAVAFALDIARGMSYLHSHKPEAVVHRDLKPSNLLLRDACGHIKVANFGLSHSVKNLEGSVEDSVSVKHSGSFCRYMAPEIHRRSAYDKSVDVFSFGLIVQEMMEGHRPFHEIEEDTEVARMYAEENKRPPFRHGGRRYPPFLRELIEKCWDKDPAERPTFNKIIPQLEIIQSNTNWKSKLKSFLGRANK
ncbi:hypothetical protein R1flu_015178 [Riccia fluitans]|uniref:Protein kinase domain-containing protein n=1 Tax=Riccia fluitans TaxID=41844 RepID=A0ABD1YLB6_9MARC